MLLSALVILFSAFSIFGMKVRAAEPVVKTGVYAGGIDMSGMTAEEATTAIENYIEELKMTEITLIVANDREVTVVAGDFGLSWANPELVTEAIELGTHGDVIDRYKILKDLEHAGKVFDIKVSVDVQAINDILAQKCVKYDVQAVNVSLARENGVFKVVEGQTGYMLDVETSIDKIYDYLTEEWDGKPCRIELEVMVDEPKGSEEELSYVTDVLGTFTTSFRTSGGARSANVINGCKLIDGVTLYPGDEFSTYEAVSPFSVENGYYMAGSYVSGKVVDSLGGGICQVSTTLYNAVLLAELEVSERYNHSMIVTYVDPSADAAIAESSGKDFKFINNTDYPIYIEGFTTDDKNITFNIYGKETRDPGHAVRYESEVLQVINPSGDIIYADATKPVGYIVSESAHIGYKARLWKITTEDGVEVSREQVNSSNYKMVPRSATVGTATADPEALNEINAAIASGNIDSVNAAIASINARIAAQSMPPEDDDE